ncbi:Fc receptor-like A [Xenopus laevis]|uniref:Fc receptor-like A n=1 Tax=Xenopus laevis TaxID=8355 RepID=A0A8J1LN85_XENLA|nr:Fc receptor-like A [Xenopus laevis]
MSLECKTRVTQQKTPSSSSVKLQFAFYRDSRVVQDFSSISGYQVFPVEMNHSGEYSCEVRTSTNSKTKMSKILAIRIQELFSIPEIKLISHPVIPGANLSITCSTVSKSVATQPRFRFYKDEILVQNESLSNNYYMNSVQLKDSGNYSCDARIYDTVKTSSQVSVQVQGEWGRFTFSDHPLEASSFRPYQNMCQHFTSDDLFVWNYSYCMMVSAWKKQKIPKKMHRNTHSLTVA